MKRAALILGLAIATALPSQAANENLAIFLKSSLYGAGIGAGVGAVALTTSDKPSENLNMVARGASLGLYVGMAYGLYQVSQKTDPGVSSSRFWIAPSAESLDAGYHFEF